MERYIPLMIFSAFLGGCFIFLTLFVKAKNMSDERVKLIDKIVTNISIILFIPVTILAVFLVVTDYVSPFGGTIDVNVEFLFFWLGVSSPAWILFSVICSINQKRKGADATANAKVAVLLQTAGLMSIGFLVYAATSMGGAPADHPQEDYFQAEYVQIDEPGIPNIDNAVIEVGNIVEFARRYWRILDIQDDRVLLLSEYVIGRLRFNELAEPTRWETSSMREYLNEDLIYRMFSAEQRTRIAETYVVNYGCLIYPGRVEDTVDRLFFLSIDEVLLYLGGSVDWSGEDDFFDDQYNAERVATLSARLGFGENQAESWWLRSSGGQMPDGESLTMVVVYDGTIAVWGGRVTQSNGLRPAMWLYLEPPAH